ncbi:hypothetical protein LOK49_LG07G01236 [Camellia lanceoleosa]|uniref:Uncharacterized protein n=1 Tax=Camellia lanceoleosa TaxID=1840588 RepID=A0ACC0H2J9_9ERIC|nr:hypothetical protein LOK49_LG07G01236 [Camellia lanceoleosa]
MESKQGPPSVIASLMGLDELSLQKPVCKPHRVLSENYLRKTASIGLLEKQSYHERRSFRVTYEEQEELMDAFEVRNIPMMDKHYIQSIQEVRANTTMTEVKKSFVRQKSETTARRNILRSFQKFENGFLTDSCGDLVIDYTSQLLNPQMELKNETCFSPSKTTKDGTHHLPSRIVVLKPNLGKSQYAAKSSFSPISEDCSQSSDRNHVEFSKLKNGELNNQVVERKILANDMETSRHTSRVSRKFAKGISRQITHSITSSLREVSITETRVDKTFMNESEVKMPSCSSFFDWKNQCETTNSPLNRSSNANQAKKQLSQRWKITKSHEELDKSGLNNQLSLNDGDTDLDSPFGISSRDGWKENARSLTRSGSIPAASITIENHESRTRNKAVHSDICLNLDESVTEEILNQRIISGPGRKVQKPECRDIVMRNARLLVWIQGIIISYEKLVLFWKTWKTKLRRKISLKKVLRNMIKNRGTQMVQDRLKIPKSSSSSVDSSRIYSEVVAVAETENVGLSSGTREKEQSEPVVCILFGKDGHSSHDFDTSVGQESLTTSQAEVLICSSSPRNDLESPMSFMEGRSPSPNSVLEPPLSEEILSGSECFQGVGADFHDFQMQLQLLKSELEETNSEGPGMVVSSDEDGGDGSVDLSEENRKLVGLFRVEESRDFSYLVDVLDKAGIHGSIMQFGFKKWYSPEYPMSPLVFEMLEKKYGDQPSWEKSERRLLFDRVNLGLKQILMDVLTWDKPLRKMFNLSQSREVIEEELWRFLGSQEKEASKDLSEKALGTEVRWFELRDDIDSIVSEIERFLFVELVAELGSIDSF